MTYRIRHFAPGLIPPDLLLQVGRLRVETWGSALASQFVVDGLWVDESDRDAHHFLVCASSDPTELLGSGRVVLVERVEDLDSHDLYCDRHLEILGPVAELGRLVVRPDRRGRGIGTLLTQHRQALAKTLGVRSLVAFVPQFRSDRLLESGWIQVAPSRPALGAGFLLVPIYRHVE
ncbi:MAG: GNAT family N-acetyltransferase [Planctomycetota bacterium]